MVSICDSNGIRTYNHLVCKPTLNQMAKQASLAKWLSLRFLTNWLWVRIPLLSLNLHISCLFWTSSSLTFMQLYRVRTKRVRDMIITYSCFYLGKETCIFHKTILILSQNHVSKSVYRKISIFVWCICVLRINFIPYPDIKILRECKPQKLCYNLCYLIICKMHSFWWLILIKSAWV